MFSDTPLCGNMLAVFPDAVGLTDERMQEVARELNLSETTFVLPPERGGLAHVRIFTPHRELPFAGHPTIGTAFVLIHLGRIPPGVSEFVFEEGIGDVPVRVERRADPFLAWLRTPPIAFGRTFDPATVAAATNLTQDDLLETPPQLVSGGNPFLYVACRDAAAVDRADFGRGAFAKLMPDAHSVGVFFFTPHGSTFYSRMLAPEAGVAEDPGTGSATGPLGAYLAKYGYIEARDGTAFTNEQGVRMKRRCLIHGVLRYGDANVLATVDIGGNACLSTIEATLRVPGA